MNKYALYHTSDSQYCFPISKNAVKIIFRTQKADPDIEKIECVWNITHFYYKDRIYQKMNLRRSDANFDYYETILETELPSLSYVFKITCKSGKSYFYYEMDISETYDFNYAYLTCFRVPFINEADIVYENKKFQGNVFYQIFPERFNLGDKQKDKSYINRPWDTIKLKSEDPSKHQDVFIGGDLQGIIDKLDYIKDLGIDVIYMTPIYPSESNHKYDVKDYFGVDKMFGNEKTLKTLVDLAHDKGLKIVLDLVFNHTSKNHPFFQDVLKNGKNSKYYNFYSFLDKPLSVDGLNYYSFASVPGMPKLNSSNPEVQKYFTEVGKYYLEKYSVDGYRLDVANEVSHDFWTHFKREIKKVDPNVILIGENWDNAYEFLKNDEFESVMNYGFYTICWDHYIHKIVNNQQFVDRLNWLLTRYKDGNNKMMLNLLDSHDTPRFYTYVNDNKDLYLNAILTLISFLGYPMIYYGDEIFMKGGGDPANRKGMEWDSVEFKSPYHKLFKDIVRLRKLQPFKSGEIDISLNENNLIIIKRYLQDEAYEVVLNNTADKKITYSCNGKIVLSNKYENNILKPWSFVVYKIK